MLYYCSNIYPLVNVKQFAIEAMAQPNSSPHLGATSVSHWKKRPVVEKSHLSQPEIDMIGIWNWDPIKFIDDVDIISWNIIVNIIGIMNIYVYI